MFLASFFISRQTVCFHFAIASGLFLISTIKRLLIGKPEFPEKSPDRTLAKFCANFIFDRPCDRGPSPQSKWKFELPGVSLANHLVNPSDLRPSQFMRSAKSCSGFKAAPTAGAVSGQPIVNACSGKTQCLDDDFRAFARLNTPYGAYSDFFQCLRGDFSSICFFHGSISGLV